MSVARRRSSLPAESSPTTPTTRTFVPNAAKPARTKPAPSSDAQSTRKKSKVFVTVADVSPPMVGVEAALAVPPESVTGAQPNGAPPSRNVTLPVGVPLVAAETVAVNVTDWPNAVDGAVDAMDVVVAAALTPCARPADVLPAKLPAPA